MNRSCLKEQRTVLLRPIVGDGFFVGATDEDR